MRINVLTVCVIVGLTAFSARVACSAEPPDSWNKHCKICHGADGKGDTKMGKKSEVKDLTDAKYQGSFTDDKAFKSIKEGLKEDGKQKMKPFQDKLSDDQIKQLVAFVRTLKS